MRKSLLVQLCLATVLSTSSYAATIYNGNDAFVDAVTPKQEPIPAYSSVFGTSGFSVGYFTGPGSTFTAFAPGTSTNGYYTGSNEEVRGFRIPNNASVPSAIVNTSNIDKTLVFGATLAAHQILLHPGAVLGDAFGGVGNPVNDAVLRFTAATAGTYTFSGLFSQLHFGTTSGGVYFGSTELSSYTKDGPVSGKVHLNAGQSLDFVVGPGTDGIGGDSTGLYAKVNLPDGGMTISLLGLAMGGVALVRRKFTV